MYPDVGPPDPAAMRTIAERIIKVDDGVIGGIVNRISAEYLPAAAGVNIIRNLVARKPQVRAAV